MNQAQLDQIYNYDAPDPNLSDNSGPSFGDSGFGFGDDDGGYLYW